MTTAGKLSLKETLRADIKAIGSPRGMNVFSQIFLLFVCPGYLVIFLYRVAAACRSKGGLGRLMSKLLWRINIFLTGCYISPKADIGAGCCMPHPTGIVIGEGAKIGTNSYIFQNVTIGQRHSDNEEDPGLYPSIGDNVKIFAGAVILGAIRVGHGANVGANAVVLKDVPDGYNAVGVPARNLSPSQKKTEEAVALKRVV